MTEERLSSLQRKILEIIVRDKDTSYLSIRNKVYRELGLTNKGSFYASYSRSIRNMDNKDLLIIYCSSTPSHCQLPNMSWGCGVRLTQKGYDTFLMLNSTHIQRSDNG